MSDLSGIAGSCWTPSPRCGAEACEPSPPADAEANKAAKDTAERRQVTVMFSDLVGSTALSARMDPEDLREVISAYQKCVAETVRRFGGFVAKYMGDGVLIYFGYPQAHEDDAEQAVRAGLELIAAVATLKTRAPLQTRVGIATGLVVVGDLIGSGEAQERGIVGETPEPCGAPARCRQAEHGRRLPKAHENSSAICSSSGLSMRWTSRASQGRSGLGRRCGALPSKAVSRHSMPRPDYARRAGRRTRSAASALGEEQRPAKARWCSFPVRPVSANRGLRPRSWSALAGEPHTRMRYFCSPQHTDSSFYPIIGQIERAAGLAYDDTAANEARQTRCAARANLNVRDRTRRFLPRCSPCQRRALSRARPCPGAAPAENTGSAHFPIRGASTTKSRADDLRGCALGRPHEPRSVRPGGRPDCEPSRSADRDLPAGVRGAMDRTSPCDCSHAQSAGRARRRRHDRPRRWATIASRRPSAKTSSNAPTEFPFLSKR